jgi:hypothetical protein
MIGDFRRRDGFPEIETGSPRRLQDLFSLLYKERLRSFPKVSLSRMQQRTHQTLDCAADLHFEIGENTDIGAAAAVPRAAEAGTAPRPHRVRLRTFSEQALHPDSRVSLSDRRDAPGLPTARMGRRLTEPDQHTMRVMALTVAQESDRRGLERVSLAHCLEDCGTRMSVLPCGLQTRAPRPA